MLLLNCPTNRATFDMTTMQPTNITNGVNIRKYSHSYKRRIQSGYLLRLKEYSDANI